MTEVKQASKAMLTLMMIITYTYIFGTGLRTVKGLARSWEGEQWRADRRQASGEVVLGAAGCLQNFLGHQMLEVTASTVAITGAVMNLGGPRFPCGTVLWALQRIQGAARNSWTVCLQEPGERNLVCS